jgi:vitamin B12 transporter
VIQGLIGMPIARFHSAFYSFFKLQNFFIMKKERKVWAMTLIVLWWWAPSQIKAQQDSIKSYNLDYVTITATKFPKNVNETAKVLTIIDEEQIARSAGKDVSQLLNEQVGIVITGANSTPGKEKGLFLQGAGSAYTLILIDGIPVNDPSGVGGAFDLRLLPIDQIERIEILKGSQSTLYGSDAIAGVINIITKKKGDKPFEGTVQAAYGSYNTFKGGLTVAGNTDKFNYNIGYTRYSTDGISEAKDPTGTGDFDLDGYTQDAFQANLGFQASSALSVKPYFRYNNFDGAYDGSAFTDAKNNRYRSNLLNTGLSAQYTLPKGAINFLYGYDKTDRTFQDAFPIPPFKGRFQHGEIFWNQNMSDRIQVLAGFSYQNIKMLDDNSAEKNPASTMASPYVSLFLKNARGAIEVGARFNIHSRFGNNFVYSINPSWLVGSHAKLFVNASTGFKAPTLAQLAGQYGANPDLKPEQSVSVEGGVQIFNSVKTFDVRLTAFSRSLTDVIYYSFDPITFASKYINLNKQADYGFEAEFSARPSSSLTLRAFYAFVDGEITDKSGARDTTYHNLIRRPKHSIGLNVGYQVKPSFYISCNVKSFGNRSDLYFNPTTFASDNVTLSSYVLLDVYLEYKLGKQNVRMFVDAKNLLNQDYQEIYGYNTLKVNIMSGLNLRF